MIRTASTLALFVPLFVCSCVTDGDGGVEPMDASTEASTDEMGEELDPNDPNVMVCPVTGAMQRIDADAGDDGHHADDEI